MSARLLVIIGPGRSGKTAGLLNVYGEALRAGPPGACLWLAPSWLAAEEVRQRLVERPPRACFASGVTTFSLFAQRILRESAKPRRLITRLARRQLIGRLIGRQRLAGRLEQLAPAARSGVLVDLADEWIGSHQRRETLRPHVESPYDEELLGLYLEYGRRVANAGLFDVESCFAGAAETLRRTWPVWLAGLRLAVVDGFNDFTPAQHEILDLLAARAEQLRVALEGEPEPRRGDLFRRPARTLEQLQTRHAQVEVKWLDPGKGKGPAGLAHLERTLFRGAGAPPPPPQGLTGIELLAAAGQSGEIEALAARVKRLLVDGDQGQPVRAHEVAVVFRSLGAVERLVAEVFARYGIPLRLPAGPLLGARGDLVALDKVLQLDLNDWPAARLLGVLGSNFFRPDGITADARAEAERAVRASGTLGGRKELQGPSALLGRLAQALDNLPQRASLGDWAKAWRALGTELGLVEDAEAWDTLGRAAHDADRAAGWLGEKPEELDRRQARAALVELMGMVRLKPSRDEAPGVRLMAARSLAGLRVPYVFLAGLTEKSFPAPADAASDEADLHACDEMLLFYSAVTGATRRLFLSYPALDESGQPLQPSPYLEEIELACGLERGARREAVDLSPIPAGEPLCAAEFRVKAVAAALGGNVSLLAGLSRAETSPGLAENLLAALDAIHQRGSPAGFGPLEGMIGDARALGPLAAAERAHSPTELERYATCPFRFLAERVMNIEPLEEPSLETDYLARGQFLHEALARLHRAVNAACGGPASPARLDAADYDRLVEQAIESVRPSGARSPLQRALTEIDRRVVRQWLADYRRQCEVYAAALAKQGLALLPAHFEVDFGREASDADPLSKAAALEFALGDERIAICGRIDRIDVGTHGARCVFGVIDYKSGAAPALDPRSVLRGLALQLPLYLMAAEEVLLADRCAAAIEAGYWMPAGSGYKSRVLVAARATAEGLQPEPAWADLRPRLAGVVARLVRGMRRGEFPVSSADDECTGRCALATVCRIQQVRWLEKTWQPADA